MNICQKSVCDKLRVSGWNFIKCYEDSTNLIPNCTQPLILTAYQYLDIDETKLEVAVILMTPLVDYSNQKFNLLNMHSIIETIEQNRSIFLNELHSEYGSVLKCDVHDDSKTNFSVKLDEAVGLDLCASGFSCQH
ncbi:unnamed protein product [Heterobilharzia americana]|nr:unnamed protein product [Heterobilharzia americana]